MGVGRGGCRSGGTTELPDLAREDAPSAATPVAMPTWRNVELMPEAMPARAGSTTPTAVEASGTLTRPAPMPATIRPGSRCVQSVAGVMPRISSRPTPISTKPGPISSASGTCADEPAGDPAVRKIAPVSGRKPHAGLDRGGAEHVLQVQHDVGEQREQRRRDRRSGDQAADEGRDAQQPEVEHRRAWRSSTSTNATSRTAAAMSEPTRWSSPSRPGGCGSARRPARASPSVNVTKPEPVGPARARARGLVDLAQRDDERERRRSAG